MDEHLYNTCLTFEMHNHTTVKHAPEVLWEPFVLPYSSLLHPDKAKWDGKDYGSYSRNMLRLFGLTAAIKP